MWDGEEGSKGAFRRKERTEKRIKTQIGRKPSERTEKGKKENQGRISYEERRKMQ